MNVHKVENFLKVERTAGLKYISAINSRFRKPGFTKALQLIK